MKIALDAMGGDYAPREIVKGAVEAAKKFGSHILLVGDEPAVRAELSKLETRGLPLEIVHCTEVIGMDEHPATSVRKKKDSSMVVGHRLVHDKMADAMISAGNTGAQMAAALFELGRIRGVERPAIATCIPTVNGHSVLLDAGANSDCKPEHLAQFARMGSLYAERALGIANPRVGLLNIGSEETKGNELSIAAHALLRQTPINFLGNVEGRGIMWGESDVVVCDGFVGNIVLKVVEGMGTALFAVMKTELSASLLSRIGAGVFLSGRLRAMKRRLDYSEIGGAPLLGVKGLSMISHGSSKAKAIQSSVGAAMRAVSQGLVQAITDSFADREGNNVEGN